MSVSNSDYVTPIKGGGYSLGSDVTANQSIDTQDIIRVLWKPDRDALFSNLAASMTRNVREVRASAHFGTASSPYSRPHETPPCAHPGIDV